MFFFFVILFFVLFKCSRTDALSSAIMTLSINRRNDSFALNKVERWCYSLQRSGWKGHAFILTDVATAPYINCQCKLLLVDGRGEDDDDDNRLLLLPNMKAQVYKFRILNYLPNEIDDVLLVDDDMMFAQSPLSLLDAARAAYAVDARVQLVGLPQGVQIRQSGAVLNEALQGSVLFIRRSRSVACLKVWERAVMTAKYRRDQAAAFESVLQRCRVALLENDDRRAPGPWVRLASANLVQETIVTRAWPLPTLVHTTGLESNRHGYFTPNEDARRHEHELLCDAIGVSVKQGGPGCNFKYEPLMPNDHRQRALDFSPFPRAIIWAINRLYMAPLLPRWFRKPVGSVNGVFRFASKCQVATMLDSIRTDACATTNAQGDDVCNILVIAPIDNGAKLWLDYLWPPSPMKRLKVVNGGNSTILVSYNGDNNGQPSLATNTTFAMIPPFPKVVDDDSIDDDNYSDSIHEMQEEVKRRRLPPSASVHFHRRWSSPSSSSSSMHLASIHWHAIVIYGLYSNRARREVNVDETWKRVCEVLATGTNLFVEGEAVESHVTPSLASSFELLRLFQDTKADRSKGKTYPPWRQYVFSN